MLLIQNEFENVYGGLTQAGFCHAISFPAVCIRRQLSVSGPQQCVFQGEADNLQQGSAFELQLSVGPEFMLDLLEAPSAHTLTPRCWARS